MHKHRALSSHVHVCVCVWVYGVQIAHLNNNSANLAPRIAWIEQKKTTHLEL